jgi:hypothetical protein
LLYIINLRVQLRGQQRAEALIFVNGRRHGEARSSVFVKAQIMAKLLEIRPPHSTLWPYFTIAWGSHLALSKNSGQELFVEVVMRMASRFGRAKGGGGISGLKTIEALAT